MTDLKVQLIKAVVGDPAISGRGIPDFPARDVAGGLVMSPREISPIIAANHFANTNLVEMLNLISVITVSFLENSLLFYAITFGSSDPVWTTIIGCLCLTLRVT